MSPHPLFPDAEDDAEIVFIKVARFVTDRETAFVPETFLAFDSDDDEHRNHRVLSDLDDVHRLFGGGRYVFAARNRKNARIVANAGPITLPGPSKPLVAEVADEEDDDIAPAHPRPPAAAELPGVLGAIVAVAGALQPLVATLLKHSTESRREHEARMAQITADARADMREFMRSNTDAANKNVEVMKDFFAAINGKGQKSAVDEIREAVALADDLAQKRGGHDDDDDDEEDDLESTLLTVAKAAQAFTSTQGPTET